jgi:mannose-6-phosphate isomerase-like protein (cupin superfamily)
MSLTASRTGAIQKLSKSGFLSPPRIYEKVLVLSHREDHRPWGCYGVLADEADHKVKRIPAYPGRLLSLQCYQHRAEHRQVIQGRTVVVRNDETISIAAGQAIDIPRLARHRIRNPGTEDMAFILVQKGDHFGEDDIERAEDDYSRT